VKGNHEMLQFFLNRLREPSTWRGIIMLATALGMAIKPDLAEAIITLGIALSGGVAVATPDRLPVLTNTEDNRNTKWGALDS
jgi:hypothetical protein